MGGGSSRVGWSGQRKGHAYVLVVQWVRDVDWNYCIPSLSFLRRTCSCDKAKFWSNATEVYITVRERADVT